MADIPKIPTLSISNRALVEMGRSAAALENYTKAIASKAGKELMKAIDQYNDVLKIANTIEAADTYAANTRKRADGDAAKALFRVNEAKAIGDATIDRETKLLDERSAKLTTDIAANDGRMKGINGRDGLVDDREKAVYARERLQDKKKEELDLRTTALEEGNTDLAKAEASLKARVDRINAATA